MIDHYLDIEQPIVELEKKIEQLRMVDTDTGVNIQAEIKRLEKKCKDLTRGIYAKLTPWDVTKVARHPNRPQFLDYVQRLFTDFEEMHGDRQLCSAPAIITGVARFNGEPVVVIGQQKGRKTKDKVHRNFGMARPEAYRKALRVMQLAEKFKLPLLTFIDTSGAYPGIDAEERNQSEAIARNLFVMSQLRVPIICTVLGEGGSGGALAIGVGDRVLMLQYSIYSVISPEGCASILWKSAEYAEDAAKAMGVTAEFNKKFNLIDEIIMEPLGGAHRDYDLSAETLKIALTRNLNELRQLSFQEILQHRYDKFMKIGLNHGAGAC